MRTDPRQDSFSFVNQGNTEMTDTVDTSDKIVQTQQVRDIAVSYALLRKMPKATIEKYRSGNGDEDPLVVLIATAVKAGESNIKSEPTDPSETNTLKSQLADASTEIASLVTKNTELHDTLSTSAEEYVENINKLTKKLVDTQSAIFNARERLKGSFFGRYDAIKKILWDIDISNK